MELGHIPFHSWSRQSQSGITDEINIKTPNTGEKNWAMLTRTVTKKKPSNLTLKQD